MNYKTQYYLDIMSKYGNPEGAGWHTAETMVKISVASPDGLIIRKIFTDWSGDYTGTEPTAFINMDSPKTIVANWQNDYLLLYIASIVATLIIASAIVTTYIIKRKMSR